MLKQLGISRLEYDKASGVPFCELTSHLSLEGESRSLEESERAAGRS